MSDHFRLSKYEFKKYLQDYFNCEYTKEEDDFYEEYWEPYLKGARYSDANSYSITSNEENTKFEIEIELYGQTFLYYKLDTTVQIVLTLPEYIIKKEKEKIEKSTMTNKASAANTDYTIVGTGYADVSKLAASHSTTSTWPVVAPSVSTTAINYDICDTLSTKADKDYVDEVKEYMDERLRGIENLWEELTIAGDPFLSMNKDKIIFKNNTYIDVKRKEENNMFNFDFGPCKDSNIKMSMYGFAVKDVNGNWVSYDKKAGNIVDVSNLTFGDGKYFYKIPVAIKDVKPGDLIIHEKRPMFVEDVDEKVGPVVVDVVSAERKNILPPRSPFGFDFITKIVSLMDMSGMSAEASADNPFGNPMMFLLMGDNGLDKLDPMMMLALMGGMGGNMKDMNPMMLALMLSNK